MNKIISVINQKLQAKLSTICKENSSGFIMPLFIILQYNIFGNFGHRYEQHCMNAISLHNIWNGMEVYDLLR